MILSTPNRLRYIVTWSIFILSFVTVLGVFGSIPVTTRGANTILRAFVVRAFQQHQFPTNIEYAQMITNPDDTDVRLNFSFPPGALTSGISIKMNVSAMSRAAFTADTPFPSGKQGANTVYEFSFTNTNTGGAITTFDKAITLTFSYSESDISGIDEATIVPYRWDGSSWNALVGYTINTVTNTVTVSTKNFSSFALLGTAPESDSSGSNSESAESSGGGGGLVVPVTGVAFSGRAHPAAKVILLKDGHIAAQTFADFGANFHITATGLSQGNYIFAIYSEDTNGNRSALLTFPTTVKNGVILDIGNIFIAPAMGADAAITKTIVVKKEKSLVRGDVNGDGKVNLVDFSIGAYWYRRVNPPLNVDINSDGKVDLVDFSIMAFYWTG